jgi:hypothetical protein
LVLAVPLGAACGGGSSSAGPAASSGHQLYKQAVAYSRCMRAHDVTDFPIPAKGPKGTLVYPVRPPAGMLSSAHYDPAFRACLKQAVISGGRQYAARYRAIAIRALQQAECMRAHGITGFPSPATVNGGIHSPDYSAIGLDRNTLKFQAAGRACGLAGLWRSVWWWSSGSGQPDQYHHAERR